jgi:hypothetical protein
VGRVRPFLAFDKEIRSVICATNSIESLNSSIRRAVNARGHRTTEQAALKFVYLAIMSLDPTGKGRKRWVSDGKLRSTPSNSPTQDDSPQAETNSTTTSYTVNLTVPQCRHNAQVGIIMKGNARQCGAAARRSKRCDRVGVRRLAVREGEHIVAGTVVAAEELALAVLHLAPAA